jgi:hypothetical protein
MRCGNAGRHLGIYTQQFYVITVEPNRTHEAVVAASRIHVISLPGYILGEKMLPPDDAKQLVEAVEKALKS